MGGWTIEIFDWALVLIAAIVALMVGVAGWHAARKALLNTTHQTAQANVALVLLPLALSLDSVDPLIGAASVAALGGSVFLKRSTLTVTWGCIALPLVGCAVALRPNYPATWITAATFLVGCIVAVRAVTTSPSRASAIVSLIDGVGVFLVASMVLWLAGIEGSQARTAGLENSLTGESRVIFPLSNLSITPAMAAVYLAAVIPIVVVYRRHRVLRLFAAGCAVAVFILAGSRSALVGVILIAGCVLIIPQVFRVVAPWITAAALSVPFFYTQIANDVGELLAANAPWMVRSSGEAVTLNRRTDIWSQALGFYTDHMGIERQTVGYGSFGQVESTASAWFDTGFRGFGYDRSLVTPHNTVMQWLFDGGWLLTALFAVIVFATAWVLSRRRSMTDMAGLAMLVTLSISSITEVSLSASHALPTWWVLVALAAAAFARSGDDSQPPGPRSAGSPQRARNLPG